MTLHSRISMRIFVYVVVTAMVFILVHASIRTRVIAVRHMTSVVTSHRRVGNMLSAVTFHPLPVSI